MKNKNVKKLSLKDLKSVKGQTVKAEIKTKF